MKLIEVFSLMRVHHYIKNLLVFGALFFSGQLFHFNLFSKNACAFIAFCFGSSVIYIINDIRDKEKDANHPVKCNRPLARGSISKIEAIILIIICLLMCMIFNGIVFNERATMVLAIFVGLNILYSFGLKCIPLLDITILVSGYIFRVAYGALITGIEISNWLYLTVMALAFYLALGKRRNELNKNGIDSRPVLKAYTKEFLDKMTYVFLTLSLTFYSLWSMDFRSSEDHGGKSLSLLFSVPIVIVIIMKYSMDIEDDSDGDPVEVVLHDKSLIVLIFLYVIDMLLLLYII